MFKKFGFGLMVVTGVILGLTGCSSSESYSPLNKGSVYIGKAATNQIIEVESNNSWKIKDMNKDDSNYAVATVEKLDEKVDDFFLIELKATEIYGDVGSFAKREGRKYILVEDNTGDLYFRWITDENIDEITSELVKKESNQEKKDYLIKGSKYEFKKQ